MIACPRCQNDEHFTQATGNFYRDLRITVTRGGATFQKSIWKKRPDGIPDGFACASKNCREPVVITQKWVKAWKLDDEPAVVGSSLDVDRLLGDLKKIADGATLNYEEQVQQDGNFAPFSSLGVESLPQAARRESAHHPDRTIRLAQEQRASIRGHGAPVESGHHFAALHGCKSEQIWGTLCLHRRSPRIARKSLWHNNFR
jgi:hypothetical protein